MMNDLSEGQSDRILQTMREESAKDRRQIEVAGGVTLIVLSLIMATVFMFAFVYTQELPAFKYLSLFFLIISLLLFARGVRDAFLGRHTQHRSRL